MVTRTINSISEGPGEFTVELFTWEKLDLVDDLKRIFGSYDSTSRVSLSIPEAGIAANHSRQERY